MNTPDEMIIGKKTLACYFGKHHWLKCTPSDLPDKPIDIPDSYGEFWVCVRCLKFRGHMTCTTPGLTYQLVVRKTEDSPHD